MLKSGFRAKIKKEYHFYVATTQHNLFVSLFLHV